MKLKEIVSSYKTSVAFFQAKSFLSFKTDTYFCVLCAEKQYNFIDLDSLAREWLVKRTRNLAYRMQQS